MYLDILPAVSSECLAHRPENFELCSPYSAHVSVYKMTILFNSLWRNYLLASISLSNRAALQADRNTPFFFNRENLYSTHTTK